MSLKFAIKWRKRISGLTRVPSVRAGLLQVLAFLSVVFLQNILAAFSLVVSFWLAAVLQGMIAAWLARQIRLASWWAPIEFLFPILSVLVLRLDLPPWVFLLGFVAMLVLYWSTYRTQVPYYPSRVSVRSVVAQYVVDKPRKRFVDIGSGMGGVVLHVAQSHLECESHGIELAPGPWFLSCLRAWLSGSHAKFYRRDYRDIDLGQYDVVFAYLSPAAMPSLWEQAKRQMHSGSLLLSYEFLIPNTTPDLEILPERGAESLYGWNM